MIDVATLYVGIGGSLGFCAHIVDGVDCEGRRGSRLRRRHCGQRVVWCAHVLKHTIPVGAARSILQLQKREAVANCMQPCTLLAVSSAYRCSIGTTGQKGAATRCGL